MNTPEFDRLNGHLPVLGKFLRGHEPALEFVVRIFRALHVWDDLIDHDKKPTDEEVNSVFFDLLVWLPGCEFYRANHALLSSTLVNAIANWHIANRLEREGDDHDQSIAFILRGAYIDVLSASALIVGGMEWVREIGPDLRRWAHEESYAEYLDNLKKETEARNV
jgi:hypothetical protein